MASHGTASHRVNDADILAAARMLMIERGPSRATLSEVARRSGVSRMTVYRRWSSLPELVGAVLHAEWDDLVDFDQVAVAARVRQVGARRTLVDKVTTTCATMRSSDLLQGIVRREPELLIPYLFRRVGRIQQAGAELLEVLIEEGQRDGTIRAGDPSLLASTIMLTAQTFVVGVEGFGGGHPAVELDGQLGQLIDRYVAPSG